jgi:hypothetical protein
MVEWILTHHIGEAIPCAPLFYARSDGGTCYSLAEQVLCGTLSFFSFPIHHTLLLITTMALGFCLRRFFAVCGLWANRSSLLCTALMRYHLLPC